MDTQFTPATTLAFTTHIPLLTHTPQLFTSSSNPLNPPVFPPVHPTAPQIRHACIISSATNSSPRKTPRPRQRVSSTPRRRTTGPPTTTEDYGTKVNAMLEQMGAAVSRTASDEKTVRKDFGKVLNAWDRSSPQFEHLVNAISGNEAQLSEDELFRVMNPHEQLPASGLELPTEFDDLSTDRDVDFPTPLERSASNALSHPPQPLPLGDATFDIAPIATTENFPALDPRKLKSGETQRRMDNLRRRKHRLATETGLNERVALHSPIPARGDIIDAFVSALPSRETQSPDHVLSYSLSRARVVDFEKAAQLKRRCAITAHAEPLIRRVMQVPYVYKPFFGLQAAFEVTNCPPCPRCKAPRYSEQATDEEGLCDNCYTQIYLEDSTLPHQRAVVGALDPASVAERKAAQEKATVEAVAVLKSVVRGQAAGVRNVSMVEAGGRGSGAAVGAVGTITKGEKGAFSSNGSGDDNDASEPPSRGASRIGDGWNVRASDRSLRTVNPIRNLVQNIDVRPNPDKDMISLSVGDPTVYGNLNVSKKAVERFTEVIRSGKANGYTMSMGSLEARRAVAQRYTTEASPLTADDVTLTAGTSGALEIAIGAIANEGDNVLLPQPGFPLFRTISEGFGVECRFYRVNPENNWEIELQDLMALADKRTAAIVVNNPSNPCGSVYSKSHIEDLLAMASLLKLPIIADEVYADMVFSSEKFTAVGSVESDVPVLSVGGISKQFVVPGWRVGWLVLHDRNGVLESGGVRKGVRQLTTRMLVPNTPTQMIVPTLLKHGVKDEAFVAVMRELEGNARFIESELGKIQGLRCIRPQGAMYAMVGVDVERLGLEDDMEFTKKLLVEEAVFVLPGQCFLAPNFVRVVFSAPRAVLAEALGRMKAFCERHWKAE
eukprot:GFKZ01012876.1.p1 GENE.GFKZ01012876.1~~GFKZ01012876.1.p1  ORF type:complete len:891 (-),score=105.03 GFKZ01012876.1:113-2785(-)